ncbi:MAG TPA: hypothetical protein VFL99_04505 [Segeticoccus sp.]|uniref:hypothetical protein n=1 Tax=Segeticoccus sp. TaxID=2706531 RepID=UPI002D81024E|nr:hypothetical protein [Segeticoccus sp.]HET8599565.1 hypothetical protein [Segeticoccus sp.]
MLILAAFRRVAHEMYAVLGALTPTHRHLRERLVAMFFLTLLVDLLASVAVLFSERHAPGTEIHTYGDAVFWTTGQLLTVSSQLPNPLTAAGRVVDILLELYAITIVTAMAGSFSAFFHRRSLERHPYVPPTPPPGRPTP